MKFVPVITTIAPAAALVGTKPVTVGGGRKVKPAKVPVPPGVVTETLPVAPPAATTALICVGEIIIKLAAAVPPKLTAVVPMKFVPVIVTVAAPAALVGVKLVMVGVRKVKVKPAKVAVPPGVTT